MLLGLGLNRGGVMAWKSGQSYSADLRSRVLAAVDGGLPARAAAERFRVSVSYIYKALARRTASGETEARPQRNHQTLKLAAHHDAIGRTRPSTSCAPGCSRPTAWRRALSALLTSLRGIGRSPMA
jgi:hypothetical protein